ncbi:toll-like receptor 21 [Notolabrus celidotus]|uniref:toll-like receptor 21 n=1 Tax=Notolabrus celidotus TaxID=1203425 RepID=UPI00148FAE2A|nr:toll-like receptor 21 [Notolabrus celidotus]
MGSLTHQLLSVTLILIAVELISSYSFKNCIEDQWSHGKSFKCIHRKEKNMSAFVADLPQSAINLTICDNPLTEVPDQSFVRLAKLQHLRMDNNSLSSIQQFAFQGLHLLKTLNLSCNNISELHPSLFQDLHSLTFLLLTNNRLKQLPEGIFSTLGNLSTLNMKQNALTQFSRIAQSVSNLSHLTSLDLCSNNLTSLNHSNVSLPRSLTTLYLSKNNLSTLGCEHSFLGFIQLLDLSYNPRLSTMAFKGVNLSYVNYLRLRSTNVSVLEFLNISNVNAGHIDFSGTHLRNDNSLVKLCVLLKKRMNWIKNMNLASNEIKSLKDSTLQYCPNITGALDLSRNEMKTTSCLDFLNQHTHLKMFNAEHNHLTSLPSCKTQKRVIFPNVEDVSYRYNRIISVNSYAFYTTPNIKTLKLNINKIVYLNLTALKGLKKLETLRLDNNFLTELFKRTFEDQIKLKTLNLRNNRIDVIFTEAFHHLKSLVILDLGGNKITHIKPYGLKGLTSLSKFYLDGNRLKNIDTSLYRDFQGTLTTLDLQGNQIRFLKEHTSSPFMNLSRLSDLKLDGQQPYGLTVIPWKFFRGLSSLESLYLTNNKIHQLPPDVFDDLKSLKFLTLDNCCVGVTHLQPGLFKNLKNLTTLIAESMVIQNFSKEVFGNLTQLHKLQLNRNGMQSISVDALESMPKLSYLDIRDVPLTCTCTNSLLQNWTLNTPKVQVVYLFNLPCQHDQKHSFHNFDTKVCYIDLGEYLFLSTAAVIFLFVVTPLLYVNLYWKLKYSYYVFQSWFGEQWRRIRDEEENCKYDAFISYNSSDEQWVMDQLLPNLEGNRSSFKLCLHHRDFELGRDIVDNIVSAVYGSRKTICVVSRNFLRSEWCSLEIQLASYRLFDEHRDVLLLVFLEPIAERLLSSYHRMRKIMLKKTYLQWPSSDCTDPTKAQELFWNQLRRAMRTGSRVEMEENDERHSCVTPGSIETEGSETQISDENYYLQP